jgi:Holliday junction resolvase
MDFGVNSQDIEWAEKIERRLPRDVFVVSAMAWAVYALYALLIRAKTFHIEALHFESLFELANLFALLLYLIAGLAVVTITTMITYVPCDLMLALLMPRYRRVQRYRKAVEIFRAWWVRTQREFWLSLSGKQFEVELAGVFRNAGFRAELTVASGDQGVDIWLYTERGKEIIQCKAHSGQVGPAVARELYGTLKHFGASAAILASTSGFTKGVKLFARNKPIRLMDLSDIIALQERNLGSNPRIVTQTRQTKLSQ